MGMLERVRERARQAVERRVGLVRTPGGGRAEPTAYEWYLWFVQGTLGHLPLTRIARSEVAVTAAVKSTDPWLSEVQLQIFRDGFRAFHERLHFPLPEALARLAREGADPEFFRDLYRIVEPVCRQRDLRTIVSAVALAEQIGLDPAVARSVREFVQEQEATVPKPTRTPGDEGSVRPSARPE